MEAPKNGFICPFVENPEWAAERLRAIEQIEESHGLLKMMSGHTIHLKKLDALDEIKTSLISSATGRDQIDAKIAMLLFKILGVCNIALVFALIALVTGQHFSLVDLIGHGK